jgi:hypothetical protein
VSSGELFVVDGSELVVVVCGVSSGDVVVVARSASGGAV